MPANKIWTYEQLTNETRERITSLLETRSNEALSQVLHRKAWAYGAYLHWNWITRGRQKDGDAEAMEALANGVAP